MSASEANYLPVRSKELERSKTLIYSLEKTPAERLAEQEYEILKQEIAETRNYLQLSTAQHEYRIKDIRSSYEIKLQQAKNERDYTFKQLQDVLINAKYSLDQEKQIELTRSHRFAISKLDLVESIEKLQRKHKILSKELQIIEDNNQKKHLDTINSLKNQYDSVCYTIRVEKKKLEEFIAEESYNLRLKLQQKNEILDKLQAEVFELQEIYEKIHANNQKKMEKIEKALKSSQKDIEEHEDKLNKLMLDETQTKFKDLNEIIKTKESILTISKNKNYNMQDTLNKLQRILYGKSNKDNAKI